jgi:hypothetical protein
VPTPVAPHVAAQGFLAVLGGAVSAKRPDVDTHLLEHVGNSLLALVQPLLYEHEDALRSAVTREDAHVIEDRGAAGGYAVGPVGSKADYVRSGRDGVDTAEMEEGTQLRAFAGRVPSIYEEAEGLF